jgi:tellurite resistance-related uncharacterized protein
MVSPLSTNISPIWDDKKLPKTAQKPETHKGTFINLIIVKISKMMTLELTETTSPTKKGRLLITLRGVHHRSQ